MPITAVHSFPNWLPQTQTWMYNQVRYLPADRIETHVVCESTENLDQFSVPNLHILGGPQSWRYWWEKVPRRLWMRHHSAFLVGTARRLNARLVHSNFGPVGWRDLRSAKRIPARHVVSFYGYDMSRLLELEPIWYERYKELFATADRILCEGPFMAQSIITNLGCPREKMRVHHLGVEVDRIAYTPRRWISGTPLRVLIAASFTEKKGIPYALQALAQVSNAAVLEITIIGDARPDPSHQREKQLIQNTIARYGLGSLVRHLGYQPHARVLEEAYRNHIFISPSVSALDGDTEGGAPVTIVEMAATGMPIVSTRHCDIPSVVESGRTGLLAEERDVNGLASHLLWLIQNPDGWQPMTQRARTHVEREFNVRIQADRLADLYQEVVDEKIAL